MPRLPDVHIDLSELNHTELVMLAKWSGLPASRGVPREILIMSLESFTPLDAVYQGLVLPMDAKRRDMKEWLTRWWDRIQMQMPKKVCPNCWECRDLQVLDCYTHNQANIKPGPARR